MKNFFESMFGSSIPKEEKQSDGAGYMAVPKHGGIDDGDVNFGSKNIEEEIRRIESVIALYEATGDSGGNDISFLMEKLENLKKTI